MLSYTAPTTLSSKHRDRQAHPTQLSPPSLSADISALLSLQEKKGQEVKKGPEVEIAKLDKLLILVREPDGRTQGQADKAPL